MMPADPHAFALALADAGLPVFPCRANKAPAMAGGFKSATLDPRESDYPEGALVGMPTGGDPKYGSGWDVVDVDRDKGGDAWLQAHRAQLPVCRIQHTRSGGVHFYLKHHPAMRSSVERIAPGVDVRADGGYVIRWDCIGLPVENPDAVAAWPDWLAAAAMPPSARRESSASAASLAPPSAAAVVDLLDRLPNPADATRDTYTRVMLAAKGCQDGLEAHGWTDDGTIAEAAAAWAERWEGGSDHDERAKWESDWSLRDAPLAGWNSLQRIAGELMPGYLQEAAAAEFATVPLPPEPAASDVFPVLRPDECALTETRPYLVKGMLAEGDAACIFGLPGAGKSLIGPLLCYMVAQGRPFFGRRTRQCRTLYVAAEDAHGMAKRVRGLLTVHGNAPGFGLLPGVSDLLAPSSPDTAKLLRTVAADRPGLIVIDTIAMAFPGLRENEADEMGRVVAVARKLAESGAAVVLIHHNPKSGDATPRGHSVLNGALDVAMLVVKEESGLIRGSLTKNRNGAVDGDLVFRVGVVGLGTDADGDPITAAVAEEVQHVPAKAPKLSERTRFCLDVLYRLTEAIHPDSPG